MTINEKHQWRVGDLCAVIAGTGVEGLIYRVLEVIPRSRGDAVKLMPVFGVITDIARRKVRTLGTGWCTPLSLVDLATEYTRFGLFIAQEAKNRGDEPKGCAEEVPTWDAGDDQGRHDPDDDRGLCTDISARVDG